MDYRLDVIRVLRHEVDVMRYNAPNVLSAGGLERGSTDYVFGVKDVVRLCRAASFRSALQATGRKHIGCIIPHAVIHNLALLRMGKKLSETCWGDWKISKSLLLNLVGYSILLCLHLFWWSHNKMSKTKIRLYWHVYYRLVPTLM